MMMPKKKEAEYILLPQNRSEKMSKYYRDIQTIKHALQHYIKRPDATEKDLNREKNLLERVEEEVCNYKEWKRIK